MQAQMSRTSVVQRSQKTNRTPQANRYATDARQNKGMHGMRAFPNAVASATYANNVGAPIQRKVGFEFQAYDSVYFESEKKSILSCLSAGILGEAKGMFKVEPDVGKKDEEMEIITEAVEETDAGRVELLNQMNKITDLTCAIKNGEKLKNLNAGGVTWNNNADEYVITVNQSVHFHPQATVGIKFENIANLIDVLTKAPYLTAGRSVSGSQYAGEGDSKTAFTPFTDKIGWSGKEDQRPFKTSWAQGLKKAQHDFPRASAKLMSFVAILYCFAEDSIKTGKTNVGIFKYHMPLLFRRGLLPHYQSLTEDEKAELKNISSEVLNAKVAATENDTITELLGKLKEDTDFNKMGYRTKSFMYFGMKSESDIGISDSESQTEPDKRRQGALIELRKLGNDVPPDQLKSFALAVFDLTQMINASTR